MKWFVLASVLVGTVAMVGCDAPRRAEKEEDDRGGHVHPHVHPLAPHLFPGSRTPSSKPAASPTATHHETHATPSQ